MRITARTTLIIVTFWLVSCSLGVERDVPAAVQQPMTQQDGPPVKAVPVAKVESEIVITPELCAQARQRDAAAQAIIATHYDSVTDFNDLYPDAEGNPTRNAKSMVAAMYWYDLAIHYDQTNESAKERRRILGGMANPDIMGMFRDFTKRWDHPPCMLQDVFEGNW